MLGAGTRHPGPPPATSRIGGSQYRSDGERATSEAGLSMPVVGDDAPEDGVVAVPEARLQWEDERLAPDHVRPAGEHRAAVHVPDRPDPARDANAVVEDEASLLRAGREHGPVRRDAAHERRVSER